MVSCRIHVGLTGAGSLTARVLLHDHLVHRTARFTARLGNTKPRNPQNQNKDEQTVENGAAMCNEWIHHDLFIPQCSNNGQEYGMLLTTILLGFLFTLEASKIIGLIEKTAMITRKEARAVRT